MQCNKFQAKTLFCIFVFRPPYLTLHFGQVQSHEIPTQKTQDGVDFKSLFDDPNPYAQRTPRRAGRMMGFVPRTNV